MRTSQFFLDIYEKLKRNKANNSKISSEIWKKRIRLQQLNSCKLCVEAKVHVITVSDRHILLNKASELISKFVN